MNQQEKVERMLAEKGERMLDLMKKWGHDVDAPIVIEYADGTKVTAPSIREQMTGKAS